ncbi:MAG: NADH-quinone oxidoreductase subunit L [Candidatus Omnitrophica bacterium]|nr:NADH-quinone oxidoreductase subunit L [Candidatus Omnitrophota bacterium]
MIPLLAWTLLFSPIAASLAIVLAGSSSKRLSAALAVGGLGISFACAAGLFLLFHGSGAVELSLPWIDLPGFLVEFGILLNPLALLMSLVVTGVGLTIFLYSVGYMAEEGGVSRYFAFLSLFCFSMLGIVLANNFITLFIFWELVGASSYLLIGFWYQRPQAAEAGKKAFLVNRIADFGFLLGILTLWSASGLGNETRTLNFLELEHRALSPELIPWIGALIFCGVLGKSAQFPLHVWLPDAMEGPTPVSALIHAATMVAAGVYLLARVFFLFAASPELLFWIAGLGCFTAFFAASLALVENDIKRVLAYSTLSQLGFMVMALGMGGAVAGMYHLTTHAFFKALLFLGAGCLIHAHHTNQIWEMGGLVKRMPVTTWTFVIGTLALCGIWPFSGFFSKDEILSVAYAHHRSLWAIGTLTAGMTAFYMGRVLAVAFLRPAPHGGDHLHEAPLIMTVPLIFLAIPSAFSGFLGIPRLLEIPGSVEVEFNRTVAMTSTAVSIAGLALALGLYLQPFSASERMPFAMRGLRNLLLHKYYVDDLYGWINRNVQQRTARTLAWFERKIIIGLWVNGTARTTGLAGEVLRLAQTGKVQTYALALMVGLTILLFASRRWAP